jgi:hypothetical protein
MAAPTRQEPRTPVVFQTHGTLHRLNISVEAFAFHHAVYFATRVGFLKRLALVVEFLSFAKGDNAFGFASFRKVNPERDHGKPTFFGAPHESQQFMFVQEQFANAFGGMVPNGSLPILFDFAAHEPKFTIFDTSVRFLDGAFSVSQTLHLATVQYDSALNGV